MNALLILALVIGANYKTENFHYHDEQGHSRGLPLVNKIYCETKDKKEFIASAKEMKGFSGLKPSNNGVLASFFSKEETLNALNKLKDAYPIVVYEGVECIAFNEIIAKSNLSSSKEEYNKRLSKIFDGEFEIFETNPKVYLVKVKKLNNPSNILTLANLIAADDPWIESARVAFTPLNGYVNATVDIETPSVTHLGQLRTLKLTVDAFDPEIKIRTDLLPQFGQALTPFPNAGEIWWDANPPEIIEGEFKDGKRTTVVNYNFKYLQYGNFVFQPVLVSYEKDGEIRTVRTNVCQYANRSILTGSPIEDIQPRTNDGLDMLALRPLVSLPVTKSADYILIRNAVGASLCGMGISLLILWWATLRTSGKTDDYEESLWWTLQDSLEADFEENWMEEYEEVAASLNDVLVEVFGYSLYSLNLDRCSDNFKVIMSELDKLYMLDAKPDAEKLGNAVDVFLQERQYEAFGGLVK